MLSAGGIYEVYFTMPVEFDISRSYMIKNAFPVTRAKIDALMGLAGKYGVRTNLLLNTPLLSFKNLRPLFEYIRYLKGLKSITISDPYQAVVFAREFKGIEIEASVMMILDNEYKIAGILKHGVRVVNVGVDLNRNISELKRIAKLKSIYPDFRVKLMPNHGCAFGCPFISFHIYLKDIYSMTGLKSNTGRAVGGSYDRCIYEDISDLADFIRRPFIRPEDINYYVSLGCGDIFKLVYRTRGSDDLRRIVKAYMEGRYQGNLLDIVDAGGAGERLYVDNQKFPAGFVKKVTTCEKILCEKCGYCRKIATRVAHIKDKNCFYE